MRWIMHVIARLRERMASKATRKANNAMRVSEEKMVEIDRMAEEVGGGAVYLKSALFNLEKALQGRGR